jgi:hypothetical protein
MSRQAIDHDAGQSELRRPGSKAGTALLSRSENMHPCPLGRGLQSEAAPVRESGVDQRRLDWGDGQSTRKGWCCEQEYRLVATAQLVGGL